MEIGQKERYKLLVGSVVPRPIALVSTQSDIGKLNLAPFSFFTVVCVNPMMLAFFPQRYKRGKELKDTAKNLFETGECVINITTKAIAEAANKASGLFDATVNEFEISGLTPISSVKIKPPRVKESPIQFECKLERSITFGNEESGGTDGMFLQVVHIHIDDTIFHEFRIDYESMEPVVRLAGNDWATLGDLFQLDRPIK